MLVTYDTMDEDDAKLGIGIGCNGIIQVLFEPIDPEDPANPIELLRSIASQRREAVIVTLFSLKDKRAPQPGTCLIVNGNELVSGGKECAELQVVLQEDALKVISGKKSAFRNYVSAAHDITAFIEFVSPPVSMVIIGAGNDVVPLARMSDILGWETMVVDGRPSLIRPERFASSCQVLVSKPEKVLEQIRIDEFTIFLLMTHNYNYDLAMLRALLPLNPAYIGSLGPRVKLDRMLREIEGEGISVSPGQLEHLYGPAGLEIGAETPEEIALAILAEIRAVFSKRSGRSLRENYGVIHSRAETRIERVRLLFRWQAQGGS